ncbi:fungal-specific transcription factor domain-containing protein [Limtongia smithiae]|uniref:fungal-specific transcription factor domain-containing protein n=1 Tax=Limtongia smithiae TaxID=1125753 RepID=UPI0034CD9AAC
MFVVQTTHSKTGLKRPDRPCDSCRRRKSRCVFSEGDSVCFLCRFHNYECVFSENPAPRKRQRRNSAEAKDAVAAGAAGASGSGTATPAPKDKDAKEPPKDATPKEFKDKDAGVPVAAPIAVAATAVTPPVITAAEPVLPGGPAPLPADLMMPSTSPVPNSIPGTTPQDKKDLDASVKRSRGSRVGSRKPSSNTVPGAAGAAGIVGVAPAPLLEQQSSMPPLFPAASNQAAPAGTPDSPFPDYDFMENTLLKDTLGLQCRRYISYIGTSAEHDPVLMNHYGFDLRDRASLPAIGPDFLTQRQIRRVQTDENDQTLTNDQVAFVVFESENLFRTGHPNPSGRDDTIGGNLVEVRKIQDIIGKFGRQLVGLYFRIVHPSLPILHKEEFLEKYYRNPSELSPSLLAGLYVFAINWWTYDADLVPFPRPKQSALEALAQINLYREIDRPTLSTVQAAILLLQHQTFRNQMTRPSHSWAMLGEVTAIAQEVGLHLDPTRWSIPEWERGLRKRLAWGLYIQDKWMALTFGRPSNIHHLNWTISDLVDENFPSDDHLSATGAPGNGDDEDGFSLRDDILSAGGGDNSGSVNRETGKVMFMELVNLTRILSDILDEFHSAKGVADLNFPAPGEDGERKGFLDDESAIKKLLARARPLQIRLKEWLENLPSCLRMDSTILGELSANGNLHLGYHAAQIALFRPILCAMAKLDRTQSPALSEIYRLVYRSAFAEFVSAVEFANSLKPQHIQTFWYAASKNNFAIIATFGFLLMLAATTDAERTACNEKLSEYQWILKVNIRGAEFLQHAILWVEECKYLLKNEFGKRGSTAKAKEQAVAAVQAHAQYQASLLQQQQQLQQQHLQLQQQAQQQQQQQQQQTPLQTAMQAQMPPNSLVGSLAPAPTQIPITMQQVMPSVPPAPQTQHPLHHLQQLQQQLHMQRQQQQQQFHMLRQQDISPYFGMTPSPNADFVEQPTAVILPSSQGPVLHPQHMIAQVLDPLPATHQQGSLHMPAQLTPPAMHPGASTTPGSNDHDIFFTSLATDGRSHVMDQHASANGGDDVDSLEFFNMRMLSHPWFEGGAGPAAVAPGPMTGSVVTEGHKSTGSMSDASASVGSATAAPATVANTVPSTGAPASNGEHTESPSNTPVTNNSTSTGLADVVKTEDDFY